MSTYAPVQTATYCHSCSGIMDSKTVTCPHCGLPQTIAPAVGESDKRRLPAMLLCILFGVFGAHRFYVGKKTSGFFQLITFGGFGIWMMVDFILILCGAFTDSDGRPILAW